MRRLDVRAVCDGFHLQRSSRGPSESRLLFWVSEMSHARSQRKDQPFVPVPVPVPHLHLVTSTLQWDDTNVSLKAQRLKSACAFLVTTGGAVIPRGVRLQRVEQSADLVKGQTRSHRLRCKVPADRCRRCHPARK